MKALGKVLGKADALKCISKGLKGIAVLDVLMLGVDIWMRDTTMNEADELAKINEIRGNNKKTQARTQLGIAVGGVAAEVAIIALCTAVGSTVPGLGTIV